MKKPRFLKRLSIVFNYSMFFIALLLFPASILIWVAIGLDVPKYFLDKTDH